MFTDNLESLSYSQFDVCVVGSGPVGYSLSYELASKGVKVLVVESGLRRGNTGIQSLSDAYIDYPRFHNKMVNVVCRSFGGASNLWGGRCVSLDQVDFLKRAHIPNSGWPIEYTDLARHEQRAAELVGCADQYVSLPTCQRASSEVEFDKLEYWVNVLQIQKHLVAAAQHPNITVLLNATVVDLILCPGFDSVQGVKFARQGTVVCFSRAKIFVLALGGIETARLLLNVQADNPHLFGGSRGALGKFYMGHISGTLGNIRFFDRGAAAKFRYMNGRQSYARRRITIAQDVQIRQSLPNISFWPDNRMLGDPAHHNGLLSGMWLALNFPGAGGLLISAPLRDSAVRTEGQKGIGLIAKHVANVLTHPADLIEGTAECVWQGMCHGRRIPRLFPMSRDGVFPLHFHAEQIPLETNQIRLVRAVDHLGLRRVSITYSPSPIDLELVFCAHRFLDRALRRSGLAELDLHHAGATTDIPAGIEPDGYHQIGLARMSTHPAQGVVDVTCRVFDFSNLYLAGSAVFPTSGQANPTLSAIALAVRLAHHIAAELRKRPVTTISTRAQAPRPEATYNHPAGGKSPSPKLRILFATASYYPAVRYGGPTYTVHALAKSLIRRGHEVSVFTTNVDGKDHILDYMKMRDGVAVHYFPVELAKIYSSNSMIESLKRECRNFDVIHAHGAFIYPSVAARRTANRFDLPFVYSPRGMLIPELMKRKSTVPKHLWFRLFERLNCAHATAIHATSEIEARGLMELGVDRKKIVVIPNGVDVPSTADLEDGAELLRSSRQPTRSYILALGRVNWKKGLDRLLKAMVHVPDRALIIAGNDEEYYGRVLHDLTRSLGLEERVEFFGPVYGMAKFALMRNAELFVLPSYSESFGVVAIEAMACGCPVIATPEVGVAHAVVDAGAGICVDGDPKEIGRRINELLGDKQRRLRMGAAGRTAARDRFSWDVIGEQFESLYMRTASGRQI